MRFLLLILISFFIIGSNAQQNFSLEAAIKYALDHNLTLAVQKLDVLDANSQIQEYTSIGLPKINGSVGYSHFIKIPTNIFPDFISPSIYDVLFKEELLPDRDIDFGSGFPVQFGTKNILNAGVELNTLLFDGSFFVGLKAQRLYRELIFKQYSQSEADIRYKVTKAYLSTLIVKENIRNLDKNISNLDRVYIELNEIYKAGFIEKLDLDRMDLSLQNLKTEREKLNRVSALTTNLLKFQMSYPIADSIVTTQSLDEILNTSYLEIMDPSIKLDLTVRPEYAVIEQSKKLAEINIRRYKASYFPSLVGFASYQTSLQRNDLFDSKENKWFPTSVVGLNLNVPIFDGFDRKAKIGRAKVLLDKTNLQLNLFEQGVQLEFENSKTQYRNTLITLDARKKSLALAERIYQVSKTKFKEGLGSSIEITTAERDLYDAQANVLDAQYEIILAKIELDKALGKL
ncbi:MAG: TolC family protein [Bacteroidota bacterium]|nr:TolC family protein [Bacteroidota bacterium]